MNFDSLLLSAIADLNYSQISVHYDLNKQTSAYIVEKIENLGGDILNIEFIKSDFLNHGIALAKLSNEDICKIVIGLNEENCLEAVGISRCG